MTAVMAAGADKHLKSIRMVASMEDIRIMLGYQKRWAEDDSPVKMLIKSRRIGGTFGEIVEDCLTAAGEIGDDIWYIAYNKEMTQEFILAAAEFVRILHNELVDIDEEIIHEVRSAKLDHYSPVTRPAYGGTTISARCLDGLRKLQEPKVSVFVPSVETLKKWHWIRQES